MGYSHYIQLIHLVSPSFTALYVFSFILNAFACICFIFSVKYLLNISNKVPFYLFIAFAILSPSLLFSSNYLMSDGLFCSLTMLWLTSGLWLVKRRNWWLMVVHLALLIFIYSTRYVGLAYVPISMGIILLSFLNSGKKNKLWEYSLILLPIILITITHSNIKEKYKAVFKVDTISPFGGWQLLNNVSTILPEIREMEASKIKGGKERELHQILMQFPDSVYTEANMLTTNQMWSKMLPPKQYLFFQMQEMQMPYSLAWAKVGVTFERYAKQIIKMYPWRYFTHYIIPSTISTFNYYGIDDWKNTFKSEKFVEEYFHISPTQLEHKEGIFPAMNMLRYLTHYLFWAVGAICIFLFVFSIKTLSKNRNKLFVLIAILGFILAYIGANIIASPNTVWRYSVPFYVPALAFIMVVLCDTWYLFCGKFPKNKTTNG